MESGSGFRPGREEDNSIDVRGGAEPDGLNLPIAKFPVTFRDGRGCPEEMMNDDRALVQAYARSGSEEAFAALVTRHVNLVYSVALRQVRDPHLAEEITQTVFILLARKASSLGSQTVVSGWLCQTARYVSARALTMQRRRLEREQEAFMQSPSSDPSHPAVSTDEDWKQIEPLLDDAMSRLPEADHNAVVLRFLEGRSYRDVSAQLGITEAAAKMRVNRAIGKLRSLLARRGVALPVASIAAAVSAHSVQAAPAGLAVSASLALAGGTAVSPTTSTLLNLTLKFMAWTKLKTALVTGIAIALAAGTTTAVVLVARAKPEPVAQASGFVGYATPEATIQSLFWAGSIGDFKRFLDGCTEEQAERLRNKMAGKTDAEVGTAAKAWAKAMTGYRITRKETVSDDEVHLHISAPPSEDGLRNGKVVVIMKRIGQDWKQSGDL